MNPTLPVCCNPAAFALMKKQMQHIESPDALLEGATAIAAHKIADVHIGRVDNMINSFADTVRKKVKGKQDQALIAHLHDYLFESHGFRGDTEDTCNFEYYCLPSVLKSKRGAPVTLSLVYKLVAQRIGLRVHGVSLPGHFLVGVEGVQHATGEASVMYIDSFGGGQEISATELKEAFKEVVDEVVWSEDVLKPVSNLLWLTRITQILLKIFGGRGEYVDVAAMLEFQMLMWPEQVHLQRDLGLVLARIGIAKQAAKWLSSYLLLNPDDPQKANILQLLDVLMG